MERRRPADLEALIRKAEKLRVSAPSAANISTIESGRDPRTAANPCVVFRRRRRVAAMNFSLPDVFLPETRGSRAR